jgi:hypothetical protein
LASSEIHAISTVSGNQPRTRRIIEKSAQTFKAGVPVSIEAASGAMIEWDGTDLTDAIAGFSQEGGSNLTTTGVAKQPSSGSVPNQPSAQNILRPVFNDGRLGFEVATVDTIFKGQVGPSQTAVVTDVGVSYGMTKDTDNQWFVDKTKTGASAAVKITKLDPNDQSSSPRGVFFTVLPAVAQLVP